MVCSWWISLIIIVFFSFSVFRFHKLDTKLACPVSFWVQSLNRINKCMSVFLAAYCWRRATKVYFSPRSSLLIHRNSMLAGSRPLPKTLIFIAAKIFVLLHGCFCVGYSHRFNWRQWSVLHFALSNGVLGALVNMVVSRPTVKPFVTVTPEMT